MPIARMSGPQLFIAGAAWDPPAPPPFPPPPLVMNFGSARFFQSAIEPPTAPLTRVISISSYVPSASKNWFSLLVIEYLKSILGSWHSPTDSSPTKTVSGFPAFFFSSRKCLTLSRPFRRRKDSGTLQRPPTVSFSSRTSNDFPSFFPPSFSFFCEKRQPLENRTLSHQRGDKRYSTTFEPTIILSPPPDQTRAPARLR